jgi:hypothetical protein
MMNADLTVALGAILAAFIVHSLTGRHASGPVRGALGQVVNAIESGVTTSREFFE